MFPSEDEEVVGYTVVKVKDLPKLHRAVWKCDMNKVKIATKGIKPSILNSFDKERRQVFNLSLSLTPLCRGFILKDFALARGGGGIVPLPPFLP